MIKGSSSHSDSQTIDINKQQSKVLLVCVCDTIAFQVSNQIIYEAFSKYGTILKILIFEKGEVTKLFVEFAGAESAVVVNMV